MARVPMFGFDLIDKGDRLVLCCNRLAVADKAGTLFDQFIRGEPFNGFICIHNNHCGTGIARPYGGNTAILLVIECHALLFAKTK